MDISQIPHEALYTSPGADAPSRVRMRKLESQHAARHSSAFGVFDDKGREYGYSYSVTREVWEVDAGSHWLVVFDEVEMLNGESFEVWPHALRDGKAFGAIPVHSRKRFDTLEAAQAYGDALVARARKRAEKVASA